MIFNIMTTDNVAYHSLLFGKVITRLFSHWHIDIQGGSFQSRPKPLEASFLHRKMRHLTILSGAQSLTQTVPPPPPTQSILNPYSLLL